MKDTRKRKTKKGDFGYFNSEKKRRLLITAGLFSLPLLISLWRGPSTEQE